MVFAEKMAKVRKVICGEFSFPLLTICIDFKELPGHLLNHEKPELFFVLFSQERFQCLFDVFTTTTNAFNVVSMLLSLLKASLSRLSF